MNAKADFIVLCEDAHDYAPLLAGLPGQVSLAQSGDEAKASFNGQTVLLAQPDLAADCLDDLPSVRWVQSTWAGVTPLLNHARSDFVLTGVKDVFGPQMAEYVFGHLLNRTQKIPLRSERQADGDWDAFPANPLQGQCLGVMGTGSIGQHIARVGRAFGMRILGLSRSGRAAEAFEAVLPIDRLADFLPELDFLVAVLPDTRETGNLLNAQAFRRMKPEAVLVNVGRGNLVDEQALGQALVDGEIAAAVLDVFKTEPLPAESPLWRTPNLVVTPHMAATSRPADIAAIFIENHARFVMGESLKYVVDRSRGY